MIRATGKDFNGFIELEVNEGPFSGIKFHYEDIKFVEENPDGSATMNFGYQITDGVPSNVAEFEKFLGDMLIKFLEDQLKKNEVVYHGGVDETTAE